MIDVPANEFAKHFGRYREIVQREDIAVTELSEKTINVIASSKMDSSMIILMI